MLRPSSPASASAAAENKIARVASLLRKAASDSRVMSTNGTKILTGPNIRKSLWKVFRVPNSTSLPIASTPTCAKAGPQGLREVEQRDELPVIGLA